jgi:hypothetical protein
VTTGSSLVTAEQFGHDVIMRPCAGTTRSDPFVMRRESGLNLRFLQGFPRSVPLHRPEPPQLHERDDGGGLPAAIRQRALADGRATLPMLRPDAAAGCCGRMLRGGQPEQPAMVPTGSQLSGVLPDTLVRLSATLAPL